MLYAYAINHAGHNSLCPKWIDNDVRPTRHDIIRKVDVLLAVRCPQGEEGRGTTNQQPVCIADNARTKFIVLY